MPKAPKDKEPKAKAPAKVKAAKEPKPKKEKKAKKEKDPHAPKKGLGAYMFFSQAKRKEVKDEFPDLKATEVAKKLGEMWAKMSESEKKEYFDMAAKDKERYEKANAEYKAKGPSKKDADDDDQDEEDGDEEDEEDD